MAGPPTKTTYWPLGGGLDVTTPALSVKPGRALALNNYEPWFNGGYRRVDGFERFDGRPKPSEQTFIGFEVSDASSLTLGDTVTGDTSSASGTVIGIYIDDGTFGTDSIGIAAGAKLTGAFQLDEPCNTGAFTIDRTPTLLFAPDNNTELVWKLEAQDLYRVDIAIVPGAGNVLGVWQRLSDVFAIRDNIGATAGILHLSSATGWTTTGITMADYIFFDAGGAISWRDLPVEGDTITGGTSGASGTVHRMVQLGGSVVDPNGDAHGYIVLTSVTGTPFTDGEDLNEGGTKFAEADGVGATFSFPINGDYRFENHNFFGGSSTYRTYGVSSVGPAFEIDENNVVSPILFPQQAIISDPPVDGDDDDPANQPEFNKPYLLEIHRNHLFLAYPGGRFAHSVNGLPLLFDGFLGAAEFGVGDEITGLQSVVGGVLAITTERMTMGLFGKTILDWEMRTIAEKTGGKLHSVQKLDTVYAMGDLGITSLARSDTFGDFIGATVSQLIQPIVTELRPKTTDSTIVRESNQYRVYFSDNTALIMYVPNAGMNADQRTLTRLQVQFGQITYPLPVNRIYNTEDETGMETTYFASDDGFAYQDQIGFNFDGAAVQSACRLVFNQIGSPAYRKRFRRAVLELQSQKPLELKVISDLTYGSEDSASGNSDLDLAAGGGFWDVDNWDEFFYDGQTVSTAQAGLTGTGTNIGLLIYNITAVARPFILQGITLHYEHRRLQR